jgi:hypothetical protein
MLRPDDQIIDPASNGEETDLTSESGEDEVGRQQRSPPNRAVLPPQRAGRLALWKGLLTGL